MQRSTPPASQPRQRVRAHARELQRQRETRRRQMRYALWLGAGVVAIAVVVALVFATRGMPGAPGEPGRRVVVMGAAHIGEGQQHVAYNSTPPTSGPHWSIGGRAPVPWGIYKEPIPDEAQIHNLEHGGIMIQYNCRDCPELVGSIENFYNTWVPENRLPLFPASSKIVVAPYYDMPTRIALTAWGRIDTMEEWDPARVIRFLEAYRSKVAPENNVP